jgi:hypothetical protein
MSKDGPVERHAKLLEKEAFTLEALATERRTLAANLRFEAQTAALKARAQKGSA